MRKICVRLRNPNVIVAQVMSDINCFPDFDRLAKMVSVNRIINVEEKPKKSKKIIKNNTNNQISKGKKHSHFRPEHVDMNTAKEVDLVQMMAEKEERKKYVKDSISKTVCSYSEKRIEAAEELDEILNMRESLKDFAKNVNFDTSQLESAGKNFALHLSQYQDLYYKSRINAHLAVFYKIIVLHVFNHVLSRRKEDNVALENNIKAGGFTNNKVLFLFTCRERCLRLVEAMKQVLMLPDESVTNYDRFVKEFQPQDSDLQREYYTRNHPLNYRVDFVGNQTEHFFVGMEIVSKSKVKLYSSDERASVFFATPLSIKRYLNAEKANVDRFCSLDILVVDEPERMVYQNWHHLLDSMESFNMLPVSGVNIDFFEVEEYFLEGLSKYMRQTVFLSAYAIPELNCLFRSGCFNVRGAVEMSCSFNNDNKLNDKGVLPLITDNKVAITCDKLFMEIEEGLDEASCIGEEVEYADVKRFEYFKNVLLPEFSRSNYSGVLIVVSEYHDYVRIRNYLKKEECLASFFVISEYTDHSVATRMRGKFAEGLISFLFITERYFYYNRNKIRNIEHLVFYKMVKNKNLFVDLIEQLELKESAKDDYATSQIFSQKNEGAGKTSKASEKPKRVSCRLLYDEYDYCCLKNVFGGKITNRMYSKEANQQFIIYPR